jgi:hypothetical protein
MYPYGILHSIIKGGFILFQMGVLRLTFLTVKKIEFDEKNPNITNVRVNSISSFEDINQSVINLSYYSPPSINDQA